jgi:thiol-disulfide isomerase/thioredoxin
MTRFPLRPLLALLLALATLPAFAGSAPTVGDSVPAFAGVTRWINSPALSTAGLRGKVVLVDFWTFECINCLHALPQVKALDAKYRDQGLVVVGVHTPELDAEHDTGNLLAAVKRLGITYPVAQDNDYATWNAWHNEYWPAQYVIDRQGRVVYTHIGEGGYGAIEQAVQQALAAR